MGNYSMPRYFQNMPVVGKPVKANAENATELRAIEDDNLVAIHWESTGTHTGEFMGVPPTGRTVTVTGASFVGHRDGKITDEAVVWDPREMLSAVGIWHLGDQRKRSTT